MRVNIYAEEMTKDVQLVRKDGHTGLRVFLKSHADLHHTEDNDDRSAVTFWGFGNVIELTKVMMQQIEIAAGHTATEPPWTTPEGRLSKDVNGRWMGCGRTFTCGDRLAVKTSGKWIVGCMEHNGKDYFFNSVPIVVLTHGMVCQAP